MYKKLYIGCTKNTFLCTLIFMSAYFPRPIADSILQSKRKVVILEGARAVGKTMMSKRQLVSKGFSYVSIADENTFALASTDLYGWLKNLNTPVVIDEAQRLPNLPLAIKEIVDNSTENSLQYVLTGSALINRNGLDGQDPLARRAQHFTMSPFTQCEIAQNSRNIVDSLIESNPNPKYEKEISREEVYKIMAAGGFPEYQQSYDSYESWEREKLVSSDILAVLGDTILPGERLDRSMAVSILNKLLCAPGGILNTSSIGQDLALDRRTIERYVSVFLRRFLINYLPNIKTAPNRQTFTRAKIHPVDTSLSVQTMISKGHDPLEDPVMYGNLLESFVVNQIMPAVQWSKTHPDCFYWRETGSSPKEVDLVLSFRGNLVGVEVKSSSMVNRNDFKGLVALSKKPEFKRGYVVYMGQKIMQWADNLWAIPLSALWECNAFE